MNKETLDSLRLLQARALYGNAGLTIEELDAFEAQKPPQGCHECGCFADQDAPCKQPPPWEPPAVTPALESAREKIRPVFEERLATLGNTIHIERISDITLALEEPRDKP